MNISLLFDNIEICSNIKAIMFNSRNKNICITIASVDIINQAVDAQLYWYICQLHLVYDMIFVANIYINAGINNTIGRIALDSKPLPEDNRFYYTTLAQGLFENKGTSQHFGQCKAKHVCRTTWI